VAASAASKAARSTAATRSSSRGRLRPPCEA
jgi:hypothetical protein